jgi:frataxin
LKTTRPFSITYPARKGLSPDSEDPQPKEAEPHTVDAAPLELSIERYNQLSDEYIDAIVSKLEELQEEREDVDVEYSVRLPSFPIPQSRQLTSF